VTGAITYGVLEAKKLSLKRAQSAEARIGTHLVEDQSRV